MRLLLTIVGGAMLGVAQYIVAIAMLIAF